MALVDTGWHWLTLIGLWQVCHADTLVIALLLDTTDALTPFTRRCVASHDAQLKPKPKFEGAAESAVAVLVADEAQRAALEAKSISVLISSLPPDP